MAYERAILRHLFQYKQILIFVQYMNQIHLTCYGETDLFRDIQHLSVCRHIIRMNILSYFPSFIVD